MLKTLPEFDPFDLDGSGFIVANPETMRAKLFAMRAAGALALRLESDLDQTILVTSLWEATRAALDRTPRRKHREASDMHVPLLDNNTLGRRGARRWQEDALHNMEEASLIHIEAETGSTRAREGAALLLALCGERGVQRIIRTAAYDIGVYSAFQANNLHADIIDATRMHTLNGRIKGYHPQTLTHDLSKDRIRSSEHAQAIAERPNALIVGDRMLDTLMSPDPHDLRVRVDGQINFEDEVAAQPYIKESFTRSLRYPNAFDAVSREDSLFPLLAMVNWLSTPVDQPVPRLFVPDSPTANSGLFVVGSR